MSKSNRIEPLQTCHNPADGGCKNPCEPGMNFCPECMKAYGMNGDKMAPPRGRYRHPIIGVGEAAQTHLRLQEETTMDEVKPVDQPKPKAECPIHGEHDGTTIGKNYTPSLCPKCVAEKKSKNLKAHGAANAKTGIMFDGFRKGWIEKEAKEHGLSVKQLLTIWIDEKIPAEEYKAGTIEDRKRGVEWL